MQIKLRRTTPAEAWLGLLAPKASALNPVVDMRKNTSSR